MTRRLAHEAEIFAGTSTGLNVLAARQLADEVGKGGIVITVTRDSGIKYLDGTLYRNDTREMNTRDTQLPIHLWVLAAFQYVGVDLAA